MRETLTAIIENFALQRDFADLPRDVASVAAVMGGRLDKARLLKIKDHFAAVRPRYEQFLSNITGVETEIFASQIPGGMISNMESQLKQQGAGDKMDEVLAEVPRVRKDAGYPPLVTPSSQIVGTQAVFNVMMGRYKVLTGEFAVALTDGGLRSARGEAELTVGI